VRSGVYLGHATGWEQDQRIGPSCVAGPSRNYRADLRAVAICGRDGARDLRSPTGGLPGYPASSGHSPPPSRIRLAMVNRSTPSPNDAAAAHRQRETKTFIVPVPSARGRITHHLSCNTPDRASPHWNSYPAGPLTDPAAHPAAGSSFHDALV
jgi:hypothetical protein